MILLSSIIATFETEFLARYGNELLPGQRNRSNRTVLPAHES